MSLSGGSTFTFVRWCIPHGAYTTSSLAEGCPGCAAALVDAGLLPPSAPEAIATEETDPSSANPYARDPDADLLPAIMAEMYRRPPMGVRPRPAPRPRNAEDR